MNKLQEFLTQQLINELETRPETQKISVGLYDPYELKEKYKDNKNIINSDCVLIINGSLSTRSMSLDEYLKTILNEEQIKDIKKAIKHKTPVLIKGVQGPTGKSTLKNILRKQGVSAIEEYELKEDITVIELNDFIESPIADIENITLD